MILAVFKLRSSISRSPRLPPARAGGQAIIGARVAVFRVQVDGRQAVFGPTGARRLGRVDEAEATPGVRPELGARRRHRTWSRWARLRGFPAVEPARRGERVDVRRLGEVLLVVHDHVDEHGADTAGVSDGAAVVAVREHRPATAELVVDALRDGDHRPADDTDEVALVGSLDDEVQVVDLDGELRDGAAARLGGEQRLANGPRELERAEAGQVAHGADGDVHGMARVVLGSSAVRDTTGPELRTASAVPSATTLPLGREIDD